jgi:hypothetical protein
VDSEALARLLRLGAIPMAYAPDAATRDLRQIVRDRIFYMRQENDIQNHVYSVLLRRGIPYEQGILGLKRKRETLRELHLPEVDRGLDGYTTSTPPASTWIEPSARRFSRRRRRNCSSRSPALAK